MAGSNPGRTDNDLANKNRRYILLTYKQNNIAPFILFSEMKHGMPIDQDATQRQRTNIKSLVRPFVGRTKLMARLIRNLTDDRYLYCFVLFCFVFVTFVIFVLM